MNDKLVLDNQNFVLSIARQYVKPGVEFDDLVSEGMIGLIKAAKLFDPGKGQMFHQYAVWHIRKAIESFLGQETQVVYKRTITDSLSGGASVDTSVVTADNRDLLEKKIATLPERQRKIMVMNLGLEEVPMNMTEIAEKLGITRYRVRAIRKKALISLSVKPKYQ